MGTASNVSLPGHTAPAVGLESPFEMLVACHGRVHRSLDLLRRLQQHLIDTGWNEDAAQAARDVMRYFDLAAPLHHQDEELHVFPILLAGSDTPMRTVVYQLQQDHQEMEVRWAQARRLLLLIAEPKVSPWTPLDSAQTTTLERFAALYGKHIEDEEGVVYPAARVLLSTQSVQIMSQDMMQRRGVR